MITIRKATKDDACKILEYCKKVGSQTDNLTFGKEGIPLTVEEEKKYLESILESDKNVYLLAIENDEIYGSITLSTSKRERLSHRGEIGITVDKKVWGHHIGSLLLEAALDFAENVAKLDIVSLEVRSDNERAIHLYEKYGFKKIGTFKGYLKINNVLIDCDYYYKKIK